MYLFYTGNVKLAGDFDYVTQGREANTVLVESRDGRTFVDKKLLLTNRDYPADYTLQPTRMASAPASWKANSPKWTAGKPNPTPPAF